MPSSGARSGTVPSRSMRGAGDGRVGPVVLACGHDTHGDPVAVISRRRRNGLYLCPNGCGLQRRKAA